MLEQLKQRMDVLKKEMDAINVLIGFYDKKNTHDILSKDISVQDAFYIAKKEKISLRIFNPFRDSQHSNADWKDTPLHVFRNYISDKSDCYLLKTPNFGRKALNELKVFIKRIEP